MSDSGLAVPKKLDDARLRNVPCPCGRGRPAKKCCLQPNGEFFVKPLDVRPKPPGTGFAHEGCYLSAYHDCSDKLCREHYVSEGILRALEAEGGLLTVAGLPWQVVDEISSLPPTALAARVLCERHNASLSPLDAAALRLFHAVQELRQPPPPGSALTLFSGHDIERWLLKTLLGILAAGIAQVEQGRRIGTVIGDVGVTDLLFDPRLWDASPALGMYLAVPDDGMAVERGQVVFHPIVDPSAREIHGGLITFRGFDLLIGTSVGIARYSGLKGALHRPYGLYSNFGLPRREIRFSWADGRRHRPVQVAFTGEDVCLRPHPPR